MKKYLTFLVVFFFSIALAYGIAPSDSTITISYVGYDGKVKEGRIAVDKDNKEEVANIFSDLLALRFPISSVDVVPETQADFEQALEKNSSFSFHIYDKATQKYKYAIILNPFANPIILRESLSKISIGEVHNSLFKADNAIGVRILPSVSAYAINAKRNPLKGKMTDDVIKIFANNQFSRYISNGDNAAYFGVFACDGLSCADKKKMKKAMKKERMKVENKVNDQAAKPKDVPFSPAVVSELSQAMKDKLIAAGTWKKGCPVPLERLNLVEFSYYNSAMSSQRGTIIIADILAPAMAKRFDSLYGMKFFMEKANARGDNPDPIIKGGTGSFNCRKITDGSIYSLHSYGTAIDISYAINPFIGAYTIDASKKKASAGTVVPGDVPLKQYVRSQPDQGGFAENIIEPMRQTGYIIWGGNWSNRTDYMHFQASVFLSYLFPYLDKETGMKLARTSIQYPELFKRLDVDLFQTELSKWTYLYQSNPARFADLFADHIKNFTPDMSTDDLLLSMYKDLMEGAGK